MINAMGTQACTFKQLWDNVSPLFILLIILNKMFQFELHSHLAGIHTKILVHEKGLVVKHIKAPARGKAQLPVL